MIRYIQLWVVTFGIHACFPEPPGLDENLSRQLAPEILLDIQPRGPVRIDEAVEVRWSSQVLMTKPPVVESASGKLDVRVESLPQGVLLNPLPTWPMSSTVSIDFSKSLSHSGKAVSGRLSIDFFTGALTDDNEAREGVVRRPVPTTYGPSNLRWLSLAGIAADVKQVQLQSEYGRELIADRASSGAPIFSILEAMVCTLNCLSERYRFLEPPYMASGPLGEVWTSSISDDTPPYLSDLSVLATPGQLTVELHSSEVVRAGGEWRSLSGWGTFKLMGEPGMRLRLTQEGQPEPDARVEIILWIEDLAGHRVQTTTMAHMPPEVNILISEFVSTPQSDWGDSEPNGEPFDAWPGQGTIGSTDEWVELINYGAEPIDLYDMALEIRSIDTSPEVTPVVFAPYLRWGDGGSIHAWRPGEALVVRLRGDMAQTGLTLELWAGALRVDQVIIQKGPEAHHAGGAPPDMVHEALVRVSDQRVQWCRPTPGTPRISLDCVSD